MQNSELDDPTLMLVTKPNAKVKVWNYIKNNMGNWNRIVVKQTEIAKEVGVHRNHVSKALKIIEEKELIVKLGKDQNNTVFMVNPKFVWKGKYEDRAAALNMFKNRQEIKTV